jgi:hypothetical protein
MSTGRSAQEFHRNIGRGAENVQIKSKNQLVGQFEPIVKGHDFTGCGKTLQGSKKCQGTTLVVPKKSAK